MCVATSELFPNWEEASHILSEFCNQTQGWIVQLDQEQGVVLIDLNYPMQRNEATGENSSWFYSFPQEYQETIKRILGELVLDYLPDLRQLLQPPLATNLPFQIVDAIDEKERWLLSQGKRSLQQEMRFRLGLYPTTTEKQIS